MPEAKDKTQGQGGPVKLAILVPSGDFWLADFALSVFSLQQLLGYHPPCEDFKFNLINDRGSLIAYQRHHLAKKVVEGGYTHALWLDSDMKFRPDLFHKLFEHDLPIVACNYVKRKIPAMPNSKDLNGKLISTTRESHGLVEADSAGFGAVLMKVEVLKAMGEPYFDTVWYEKDDKLEMVGEDVFFFRKARHLGYPLYMDHDASQHVSHIGTFEYDNALCEATWDEVELDELKEKMVG